MTYPKNVTFSKNNSLMYGIAYIQWDAFWPFPVRSHIMLLYCMWHKIMGKGKYDLFVGRSNILFNDDKHNLKKINS